MSVGSNDQSPEGPDPPVHNQQDQLEGESEEQRIERLGRQRPEKLDSLWKEIGFVFSITVSQLLNEYFVSGFVILLPTVAQELDILPSSQTWCVSLRREAGNFHGMPRKILSELLPKAARLLCDTC